MLLITVLFALLRFGWWLLTVRPKLYGDPEHLVGKAKAAIIFSLSGARGTVTLANVMSIPLLLPDGSAFPERDLIILLSAGVIICSLIVTNFILPLFADQKTERSKSEQEEVADIEILHTVIIQLNQQVTSETRAATEFITRVYYGRSAALERRQVISPQEIEEEKRLSLEVLGWEKENTLQMIADGSIAKADAVHYLEVLNARIESQTPGHKATGPFRRIAWWFGHLMRFSGHGDNRPQEHGALWDILAANDQAVLDRLHAMKQDGDNAALEKMIAEKEISIALHQSRGGGLRGAAGAEVGESSILEVAAKRFQMERDLIQQMLKPGVFPTRPQKRCAGISRPWRRGCKLAEKQPDDQ